MTSKSATSNTIVRIELGLVLLAACVRDRPAPADAGVSSAAPIASVSPSSSGIPAELACQSDADCVAIPSGCCEALASNAAHIAAVRKVARAMDAGGDCKKPCASPVTHAACNQGRCVVW